MSKGPTKAQLALAEAREWIEASKMEVRERETALDQARSQLEMHETIYAILEKTFTRQPAKTTTKKASKKSSKSSTKSQRASSIQQQIQSTTRTVAEKPVLCTYSINGKVCHGTENDGIHDAAMGYAAYHPFVSPSPARNAGERSSSGKFTPSSLPASSEVETESVSSATGG